MEKLKKQFFLSLQRGLGRAIFMLKENPEIDFSAEILKAVKKSYAYDAQSNGSAQGKYLFEVIQLSPQQDMLRRQVFAWFQNTKDDAFYNRELSLWCEIIACYALQGDEEARKLLYAHILASANNDRWYFVRHLLKVEGLKGLLFVLDLKGKKYEENPEYDNHDWYWIEKLQEKNEHLNVLNEVVQASQTNPYIKLYLDEYLAYQEKKQAKEQKPIEEWNFEKLVKRIRQLDSRKPLIITDKIEAFLESLTEAEVKQLADSFLEIKFSVIKERYLSVFEYIKFPYGYHILLDIVQKETTSHKEELLRDTAIDALTLFQADDIRAFALEKISELADCETFLPLLASDYQEGDSKIIMQCLQKIRSADRFHSVNYALKKIYTKKKTKDCFKPLAYLYERVNCGICREGILELMQENGVLSEEIRQEIQFDANDRVRNLCSNMDKIT